MKRIQLGAFMLLLVATGCSGGGASPDLTLPRNPDSVAAGEALYVTNCASCHGVEAAGGRVPGGGRAPSLVAKTGVSDAILTEIVKRGRGLNMPSFSALLDDGEIASLVDYIRTVQVAQLDEG